MLVPHEEPKKPRKPKKPSKPKEPTNKPRVRSLPVPVPASSAPLSVVNPDAAGVDVHSDMHMVCVPADRDVDPVRWSAFPLTATLTQSASSVPTPPIFRRSLCG